MRNEKARIPDPNEFTTNSGDEFYIIYNAKLLDDGTVYLKESDKEDIQAKIDSYRDTTDMAYVLRQLMLGDTSVLAKSQPMYGDFTQMPKNMLDAMQLMIDGEKAFYELDLDTRQKFDNNFRKWMIDAGSADWLQKMGVKTDAPQEPVDKEEVKTE